ncbi:chorismate-binding protein [Okibacterium endophyticum]
MAGPDARTLTVETTRIDDSRRLIPFTDPEHPLVWSRKGQGIVGIGEAIRLEFFGASRFRDAVAAWKQVVTASSVNDEVRMPGTGLVAFGAFTFADSSTRSSVLIVPRVIVGRRGDTHWMTTVRAAGDEAVPPVTPTPYGDEYRITLVPGHETPESYTRHVTDAVDRILGARLSKVVLARDLVGHLPAGADLRRVLFELSLGYPDCWTYAVDGLVGSSPETLVSVNHGVVGARVLAGTTSRGKDALADHDAAIGLVTSTKDQDEHQFAVQSVLASLRPHTAHLTTSEVPFALKLPNLWHLATDVEGTLSDGSTSLDLIAAQHPTAAVAGTPTSDAIAVIEELEPFDRGRYAGPVGWVGADGDGEWAIALRSAQVAGNGDITAHAGCGIVAGSDAARELTETRMKFRPVVEAFG